MRNLKKAPASPEAPGRRPARAVTTDSEKLHKVLAAAGLGARREMEAWISAGRVTVNQLPAQIGMRVTPEDVVRVDGHAVRPARTAASPRVLLYHKPEGEVVTRSDPAGRPTVFDTLPRLKGRQWIAVGRLDINTSGLLIFTNNGDVAQRLSHPGSNLEREYAVRVLGDLTAAQVQMLRAGVQLDDGMARFTGIVPVGGEGANRWYRVSLTEGRNREVRRMFETLGVVVSRLTRIRFGPIELPPQLRRGRWMELDPQLVHAVIAAVG